MATATMNHEPYMRRALELASRGTGHVAPNPRVGCVIVHNDHIIAEGWHAVFGGPHAEVAALAGLDTVPADATMYVTLEPCAHQGKTPPCTNAIIASGIRNVVVGMSDPNPMVSGRGIAALREAGISVVTDVLAHECLWLNRGFAHWMTHRRPWVMAKIGQSLDGCMATWNGASKWITSQASRHVVHALRGEVDAVLTGVGTVLADDPLFTVRHVDGRSPMRIVLDTQLRTPIDGALVASTAVSPVVILCAADVNDSDAAQALRDRGCSVIGIPSVNGRLSIADALDVCATQFSVTMLLVEAGPTVLTSLLANNAIHELRLHTAPILLGDGLRWNMLRPDHPSTASTWVVHSLDYVDGDVHTTLLPVMP
ncbi:MAG: bifunctional diaminohydroxyphosphoribosylaminopyrimidine deaminase/5-amino-6-(5-phosphoribosylamino)uracil reductase RibD [Candidatus Kapabacteria bacterium]|nr:bifunctional diaminohydroxyphosphoribosylaminopyrimidine deaminase/5-amino-6-(5-phosphoribosylamino)uracil reductase RibD [Candidatus Kapabacteria bacterium]